MLACIASLGIVEGWQSQLTHSSLLLAWGGRAGAPMYWYCGACSITIGTFCIFVRIAYAFTE